MTRRCDLIIPPEISHDIEDVTRYKIAAENAARNAAARVVEFVEWRGTRIEVNEFLRRAESATGDERRELRNALFNWNPYCGRRGPDGNKSRDEAIAAWNRRAGEVGK